MLSDMYTNTKTTLTESRQYRISPQDGRGPEMHFRKLNSFKLAQHPKDVPIMMQDVS